MIFSTVSLPRFFPLATARRAISVSVTMPTNCFPCFTNSDPTRSLRMVLAALTTEVLGPIDFGLLFIICPTLGIIFSFHHSFTGEERTPAVHLSFSALILPRISHSPILFPTMDKFWKTRWQRETKRPCLQDDQSGM